MSTLDSLNIFSINGFSGDMWSGPQAEVAQHLSDQGLKLATWWPVGYEDTSIPLSTGVAAGRAELQRLRQLHPGPCLISAWSEGAVIATLELQSDPQLLADCKGGAFYGNPYRAAGQWNPSGSALGAVGDPGGAGVGGPGNNWRTPDSIHHYCHGPNQPSYDGLPGVDQYTCCSTGVDGDVARIFYNFVFAKWTGAFQEILVVAEDFATQFGVTLLSALKTAINWIEFFASGTGPHVDYTSHAGASYLANLAATLP